MKMAREDGTLTKENFIKILRSSDLFLKAFDKNKDNNNLLLRAVLGDCYSLYHLFPVVEILTI